MKKLIKRRKVRRKCLRCGRFIVTTSKDKDYYCEPCMKKFFKLNYCGDPEFIETELSETKIDYTNVICMIVGFLIGLVIGRVVI